MAKIATRNAFGEALVEVGQADPRVLVFDADVSTCTMSCHFGEHFPERFFNVGIAEANMVDMAAGAASCGYTCFVSTFAMFAAGRTFDQIRNTLAYPGLNVKVVGTHAGLTVGEDGATHQCLEDIAIMRVIPGMTVVCPADGNETIAAVHALAKTKKPAYLRLGRMALETVTDVPGYHFELGKAVTLREGTDAAIFATGIMVGMAVEAATALESEGLSVRVIDMHTIKPLDVDAVRAAARETGCIVTAEEHNIIGGLGSAVCEALSEEPVPVYRLGTNDTFGRSGNADALLKIYGLTSEAIAAKVRTAVANKH